MGGGSVFIHPDDHALELFALGKASAFEATLVVEHLLVCSACVERKIRLAGLAAAGQYELGCITSELIGVHDTTDGPVYMYARQQEDHWIGTIRGENTDGGIIAASRSQVINDLHKAFTDMFDEHVCSLRCIGVMTNQSAK